MHVNPSERQYVSLQEAYSYFNRELFDNQLSPVLITFQRQKKSHGYYWHDVLSSRHNEGKLSEIALNIAGFSARDDKAIFSTLVHEMVHHWQCCHGKPSRNGYHNAEFAYKMRCVGLIASDTGQPGGKTTGQNMTHYVLIDGAFDRAFAQLDATIDWNACDPAKGSKKSKKANKVKYTCPCCGANAWGKAGLYLICGEDRESMLAAESDDEETED